jgi:hypothetical protein
MGHVKTPLGANVCLTGKAPTIDGAGQWPNVSHTQMAASLAHDALQPARDRGQSLLVTAYGRARACDSYVEASQGDLSHDQLIPVK